jgi:cell division protein FtsB
MTSHPRARKYLLRTLTLAAALGILVYLVGGLIGGERGLAAAKRLNSDIAGLQVRLTALDDERTYLQKRVDALDPDHVDLDMLSEEARRVLFYSEPDEIQIVPGARAAQK